MWVANDGQLHWNILSSVVLLLHCNGKTAQLSIISPVIYSVAEGSKIYQWVSETLKRETALAFLVP